MLRELSARFSPPLVDFFEATRLDDYEGKNTNRFSHRRHHSINDVEARDFNDFREFSYMRPQDLIFYLHPIFSAYSANPELDAIDFYLLSIERELESIKELLTTEEAHTLSHALQVMLESTWLARISGDTQEPQNGLCVEILFAIDIESCPKLSTFLKQKTKALLTHP